MKLKKSEIKKFQRMIWEWWNKNKRDLPWRRTKDPYKIFISEIMLQQTQVDRVLPKYKEFIKTYPTVHTLAKANLAEIIKLWKGMGYNRRAVYLKRAAEMIIKNYRGTFPSDSKELEKLPGVGKYTAAAICCFAFGKDEVVVDTNVRQIISHFFIKKGATESEIYNVAQLILPEGRGWEWHQALMDFGALALPKTKNNHKNGQKFTDSRRFYRGRIIDFLRSGNKRMNEIEQFVLTIRSPLLYPIEELLSGLKKDHLVNIQGTGRNLHVRLPS